MTRDDDLKCKGAEAMLEALFSSMSANDQLSLGEVVALWRQQVGIKALYHIAIKDRFQIAGLLTINNAITGVRCGDASNGHGMDRDNLRPSPEQPGGNRPGQ